MSAALSWEFPMPNNPPSRPMTKEEIDRKLAKFLLDQEDDAKRPQTIIEARLLKMTNSIMGEIQGLKDFFHDEIRGLKSRIRDVEKKQELITTDSGSWDIEKLQAQMELKLRERDLAYAQEKLQEEKEKPKGILAEFGPKILSHTIAAVLTAIVIYALMHGVQGH